MRPVAAAPLIAALLLLAGCGTKTDDAQALDTLDAELADGNGQAGARDPALTAALRDQIMVDPALAGQSNRDAVRPARQPYAAPVPPDRAVRRIAADAPVSDLAKPAPPAASGCPGCAERRQAMTLAGVAERRGGGACARALRYSARWATQLPAALPLYPDARVREAAGTAEGGCQLRVVSFASAAPVQTVLDWYYARASAAGYSAEHQADETTHLLAGTKGAAAYALFATPRGDGGADVDLIVNNGR